MWNVQLPAKKKKIVFYMTVEPKYFLTSTNAQTGANFLQKAYATHAQETCPGFLTMAERLTFITCASPWLKHSTEAKHSCLIFFSCQNIFGCLKTGPKTNWRSDWNYGLGRAKKTQGHRSGVESLGPVSVLLWVDEVCWTSLLVAQEGHSFSPFQKTRDDCKNWYA